MSSRTRQAIRGSVTGILQNLLAILFQLVTAPMVLAYAGREALGGYAMVMQLIGYGLLLDFGFAVAFTRYLCLNFDSHLQAHRFEEILSVGRTILLGTNLLAALILAIVSQKIGLLLDDSSGVQSDVRNALLLMSFWMVARTPLFIYQHALTATQNLALVNLVGIAANATKLVLAVALTYAGYGVTGLVVATIGAEVVQYAIQVAAFKSKYRTAPLSWLNCNWTTGREIVRFGFRYWGVNLSVVLLLASDNLIAGSIFGAAAASVYYSTKMLGSLAIQLMSRIIDSIYPAMSELIGKGDLAAARNAYLKALRYLGLMLVPVAIGIALFTGDLVSLWLGERQYAGPIMASALAAYVLIQVLTHLHGISNLATGRIEHWSTLSVVCGVLGVSLGYLAGAFIGLQWILAAIALMMLLPLWFLAYRVWTALSIRPTDVWDVARPVCRAGLATVPFVLYSLTGGGSSGIVGLVSLLCIYAATIVAATWLMGIDAAERVAIKTKLSVCAYWRRPTEHDRKQMDLSK